MGGLAGVETAAKSLSPTSLYQETGLSAQTKQYPPLRHRWRFARSHGDRHSNFTGIKLTTDEDYQTGHVAVLAIRQKPKRFMNNTIVKTGLSVLCRGYLFLIVATNAHGMDRWSALAMIESNGDDAAVGRHGEISRYQIRPALWRGGNRLDANAALANAQRIMSSRLGKFQRAWGRPPNDFEFYILWNAPAQVRHPHSAVAKRATRFANLLAEGEANLAPTISAQPGTPRPNVRSTAHGNS